MNAAGKELLHIASIVGHPQAFGPVHDDECDSALGVLHRQAHPLYGSPTLASAKERRIYSLSTYCLELVAWTFEFEKVSLRCVCCAATRRAGIESWLIEHYNHTHRWSFEEIANMLGT